MARGWEQARQFFGSVRVRITFAAAGLVAVGLAAASFGLVRSVHASLLSGIQNTNREQLSMVARQLEAGRAPNQVNFPSDPGEGGAPSMFLVAPDGTIVGVGVAPVPVPRDSLPSFNQSVRDQQRIATQQGDSTLIAERSIGDVNRTVHSITDDLLLGVPLLVAAIAMLAWYLTGRALRPVELIRAEAASITGSTMHRRVPEPDTSDEVGRLAHTMNAMLDRLEESFDAPAPVRRRRVARAAQPGRGDPRPARGRAAPRRRGGLAPYRPPGPRRGPAPRGRGRRAARAGPRRGGGPGEPGRGGPRRPGPRGDDPGAARADRHVARVSAGRVLGNPRQLSRVVRNLLDNASSHARSRAAVAVSTGEGSVWLVVDDDGPGIPAEDRERVFDRFTRLDEGRGRAGGGAGLGLAMVRAIAEGHGGSVRNRRGPAGRHAVRGPPAECGGERLVG